MFPSILYFGDERYDQSIVSTKTFDVGCYYVCYAIDFTANKMIMI